jgi:hypothetical protein
LAVQFVDDEVQAARSFPAYIPTESPTPRRSLLPDVLNLPITADELVHVQVVDEAPVKLNNLEHAQLLSEMPARSVAAVKIIVM